MKKSYIVPETHVVALHVRAPFLELSQVTSIGETPASEPSYAPKLRNRNLWDDKWE